MDAFGLRLLGGPPILIGGRESARPSEWRHLAEIIGREARYNLAARKALINWHVRTQWPRAIREYREDLDIIDDLVQAIASGRVHVAEVEERPTTIASRRPARDQPSLPEPIVPQQVVESNKSLFIVHCPPLFAPEHEPLRIRYVLRGLAGHPVELVVHSQVDPSPLHRRMLPPAETADGPGELEWNGRRDSDGQLVQADAAPLLVELIHDDTYRDEAPTTIHATVHVMTLDGFFHTSSAMFLPSRPARGGGPASAVAFADAEEIQMHIHLHTCLTRQMR